MSIGLVLGSGAVLGGAWEIGALEALAEETGWDPRAADYFIGTSAGALMAALLAAGVLPQLDLTDATDRKLELLPWPLPGSIRLGLHGLRASGGRRWLMTLAGLLPRGAFSTEPIQRAVFRRIPNGWPRQKRLWIVAADYQTGQRVVFGRAGAPRAELASAVAASCAIPGVYRPVEIAGRLYVDGGLYSTDNLDLLVGTGVDTVVCINPLSSACADLRPRRLAARLLAGAEKLAHRQVLGSVQALRRSGTRVVLLEPGSEALRVMGLNLMNRDRVRRVAEIARMTVRQELRTGAASTALA